LVTLARVGQVHAPEALVRDLLDCLRLLHVDDVDDESMLRLRLYESEIWLLGGRGKAARGKIRRVRGRALAIQSASLLEVCDELTAGHLTTRSPDLMWLAAVFGRTAGP
jgi:hypothetical protein